MIDEVQVRNVALIREAVLEPAVGLTVVTGETGAGKTALLSALKLLMGERADKSVVREGSNGLEVNGRFLNIALPSDEAGEGEGARSNSDSDSGSESELDGADNLLDPATFSETSSAISPSAAPVIAEELIVSRRVSADGRSRATIDGSMASVKELAAIIAPTIDLCGQHEHQQLLNTATHVAMLDAWGGEAVSAALRDYQQAFDAAQKAARALAHVKEATSASTAALSDARFTLKRIDEVDPNPGEYEEILAELEKIEHAEALAVASNTAHNALSGENGALDAVGSAIAALNTGARYDAALGSLADSLREASYVLEDVSREAFSYCDSLEFDPEALAQKQERLAAYQGILRLYGPRIEDVLAAREEAADLVSLVDDGEARIAAAERAVDEAETGLAKVAKALDQARSEAAPRFAEAVHAQMAHLEMGSAELVCEVSPLPRKSWSRMGSSSVEFLFKPGAAMTARPLARIASGGEISRVMLAIKVVLGAHDAVDTLVFDEVDAGVGGAVAQALAEVLADLSQTHQVIVVTHLAQVAVRGDRHYVVRKYEAEAEAGVPETHLVALEPSERPQEIARMLSGDLTETSLAHAQELLAKAHSAK